MGNIYDEQYRMEDYYWGFKPSIMCCKILEKYPPVKKLKLLDIGCGEGKDAVFFARNGYDVTAFDVAETSVEKTKRLADKIGVSINAFKADVNGFRLDSEFDILYSNGVMHYIPEELRKDIFDNYKQFTAVNGIHMFSVFVQKSFIEPAPEREENATKWISGEIFTYYHDWLIEQSEEVVFNCMSSGIPHKHAMNRIMARRV